MPRHRLVLCVAALLVFACGTYLLLSRGEYLYLVPDRRVLRA